MKKFLIVIIFLLITLICSAQESVAVSLKVKGNVELSRSETKDKLTAGVELYNGDQLESWEESFAALKFIDGSTIVKLFPLSILSINTETIDGKLNKRTKLDLGELWTRVDPGSGGFEVETPTTVVSVKGTQFLVEVAADGSTTLFTITGKVEMRNKGNEESVIVNEGEKAYSTGSGQIDVVPYDIEEIDVDVEEEEDTQTLEIQLENEDGEKKTILIDLE